tara:strand:- start:943 stop:1401 length:459 start_codon:yes stop_codon:yes gene_type:complete
MKKIEEGLIDKLVALYLDGGWEVSGKVKKVTDSNIVLEQSGDADLILVFRSKISCLRMLKEVSHDAVSSNEMNLEPEGTRPTVRKNNVDETFPMNRMAYDESGMTIPQGLLGNAPSNSDDDLSISFGDSGTGFNDSPNKVEFRIGDDSTKED